MAVLMVEDHHDQGGDGGGGASGGGGRRKTKGWLGVAAAGAILWRNNKYVLLLSSTAGLGGLLFGYDTGVISGALLFIRRDIAAVRASTLLQETVVSMAVAGAAVGSALGGPLNDRLGRRPAILTADLLFVAGAATSSLARGAATLVAGRVLAGLGFGLASVTAPIYIAETSPSAYRGALVTTSTLYITAGQVLSFAVGLGFTRVRGTWRWMLGVAGLPALLQLSLMLFLPESPRWLFRRGKTHEAVDVLARIYPSDEQKLAAEVEELGRSAQAEKELLTSTTSRFAILDVLASKEIRLAMVAGVGLQVFRQLAGFNTVLYYIPTIVQMAGYTSDMTAILISLMIAGVNTLGTIAGMFYIERLGRRPLAMRSLLGVIASLGLLAAAFHVACGWLVLVGLVLYVAAFSPGLGPVPWAVNAEIYPLRYRGLCSGSATSANWLANLLVSQTFLSLTRALTTSFTFLLFCGASVVALVFVYLLVPETKGLSFEQVEQMWKRRARGIDVCTRAEAVVEDAPSP